MHTVNSKVKYKLVKLPKLSGEQASVYSIYLESEQQTLFDRFITENKDDYQQELTNIITRIKAIGTKVGAREQYFKLNEGKLGDLVCALYDEPEKHLRLFCLRFGTVCIILGGGGPKNVAAWQDDPKLTEEASWMINVSKAIFDRMNDDEINLSQDGFDLEGNLIFNDEEE